MKLIMTDIVRNVSEFIDGESTRPEMVTLTLYGLNNIQFKECQSILTEIIGEMIFKDVSQVNTEDEIDSGRKTINFLVKEECPRDNIKCVILGLEDAGRMTNVYSVKLIIKRGITISREHMQGFAMALDRRLGALSPYGGLHYDHLYHHIAPEVYYNSTNTSNYTTTDPVILNRILDILYNPEKGIIDKGLELIDQSTEANSPLYFIMPYALKKKMIEVLCSVLQSEYSVLEVDNSTRNEIFTILLYNQVNEPCQIEFTFNNMDGNSMAIIVEGVTFGTYKDSTPPQFTKPSTFIYFLNALKKNYSFDDSDEQV